MFNAILTQRMNGHSLEVLQLIFKKENDCLARYAVKRHLMRYRELHAGDGF
jgi:hypothetical protein